MLGEFQRGAYEFHVVLAEEGCVHEIGFAVGGVAKELFHLACGGEGDEHPCGCRSCSDEGVGDFAGCEYGVTWFEPQPLLADLEEDLAFHDVEPLVLREMEVQGRAAGEEVVVLDYEEVATGLLGGGLEGDAAEAEGAVLAEDVLSGGDHVRFFQGGVGGGESEGLREGEGKG